ncbi:hypothetical protein D9M68_948010 [compost metagenome]
MCRHEGRPAGIHAATNKSEQFNDFAQWLMASLLSGKRCAMAVTLSDRRLPGGFVAT